MACISALPHAASLGMATRQGRVFARTPAAWVCSAREVHGNDFIILPPSGSGKSRVAHGEDQRGPKQLTPVVVGQYDWDSYLGASATRSRMAACQKSPAGGKCFPGIPWALPPSDGCGRSPPPEIRHSRFLRPFGSLLPGANRRLTRGRRLLRVLELTATRLWAVLSGK